MARKKLSRADKDWLARMLDSMGPRLEGYLKRALDEDPTEGLKVVVQYLEFVRPKLGRTEVTGANGGPLVVDRVMFGKLPK